MKKYKFIGYDNNEKEYISTTIKAKNLIQAYNQVNDLPVTETFFNYLGNKKPKFEGETINLTLPQYFIGGVE